MKNHKRYQPINCDKCKDRRVEVLPSHEYTFMGRTFMASAKQIPCTACSDVTVTAIRTDCHDGMRALGPVQLNVIREGFKEIIKIGEGSVTGYESAYVTKGFLEAVATCGWVANMGTDDRWDSLVIPAKQMTKAIVALRLNT